MFRKLNTVMSSLQPMLADVAILFLRCAFGGLMVVGHGWTKLMRWDELSPKFADPLGVGSPTSLACAIFAEVACSGGVILGFMTRACALLLVFTMTMAAFVVRASDPFFIHNGLSKEPAVLYMLAFLTVAIYGGGRYSVDRLLWKEKPQIRT